MAYFGNNSCRFWVFASSNGTIGDSFNVSSVSEIGNGNDECCCGTMFVFNPYSNEFVKNFIYRGSNAQGNGDYMVEINVSGYFNTTSAIDALRFKFESGNIDSGTIKLYGIKDS